MQSLADLEFDHEFTVQFHFAWEVARLLSFSDDLNVRFEVPCGKDADGETIRLDLLLTENGVRNSTKQSDFDAQAPRSAPVGATA
jgi:hypothetical protein